MVKLVFELSMPGVGSWNGKWTGSDNYYAVVRDLGRGKAGEEKAAALAGQSFGYNFGDGWFARVKVRRLATAPEVRSIRKRSCGFCGYDWMIDSILKHGEIVAE